MAWAVTKEGIFQCGIVLVKNEKIPASLYFLYLQYWALCGGLSNSEQLSSTCPFYYTHSDNSTCQYNLDELQFTLINFYIR